MKIERIYEDLMAAAAKQKERANYLRANSLPFGPDEILYGLSAEVHRLEQEYADANTDMAVRIASA